MLDFRSFNSTCVHDPFPHSAMKCFIKFRDTHSLGTNNGQAVPRQDWAYPFYLRYFTLFYFDNVSCIMANNNYCILFGFGDPTTKPFTISRRLVPRTLLTWRTTTRLLTDFPTTPTVSRGAPSPLLSRDQTAFSLPSPLRILPSYCFQPRVSSGQHNPLLTYLIQVSRDPTALTRMDSECRGREGGLSLPYLRLLITWFYFDDISCMPRLP